jgi:uroporphyrinogen-III synthase
MHPDPFVTRVILTREAPDNDELAARLKVKGVTTLEYPCIKTTLLPYRAGTLLDGLPPWEFDAVAFTSKRGVAGMREAYLQLSESNTLLAVVGMTTALAVHLNIRREADIVAEPATGESLALLLLERLKTSNRPPRVLHARGNKGSETFKSILVNGGFQVTETTVYRNEMPEPKPLPLSVLRNGIAVFASPSAAMCFFNVNRSPEIKNQLKVLAIGPVTAEYLKNIGVSSVFEARKPEADCLMDQLELIIRNKSVEIKGQGSDRTDFQIEDIRRIVK